jgi:hypothetical protein
MQGRSTFICASCCPARIAGTSGDALMLLWRPAPLRAGSALGNGIVVGRNGRLVLLSQSVAAFVDGNHIFEKTHFSACGG